MSGILDAATGATELATARTPDRWAWVIPIVAAVVLVALAAVIVGSMVFAADPMTAT